MSIFKTKGFDSIIGKDVTINGDIFLAPDHVLVIDGTVSSDTISMSDPSQASKASLIVNGSVTATQLVRACNITVCGTVTAKSVRAERTLAVKAGCRLEAEVIYYRDMVVEPGAIIFGTMKHLDHVTEGEV